jgi:hypothetical protein
LMIVDFRFEKIFIDQPVLLLLNRSWVDSHVMYCSICSSNTTSHNIFYNILFKELSSEQQIYITTTYEFHKTLFRSFIRMNQAENSTTFYNNTNCRTSKNITAVIQQKEKCWVVAIWNIAIDLFGGLYIVGC